MVFKKPYAFLIKYFRIINFLLAVLSGYIIYRTYSIVGFFNSYITNNYTGNFYEGFYTNYINPFVFLFVILICLGVGGILWLFIYKKKPYKGYLACIIYYIALIIFLNFVKSLMITMETTVITAEATRAYRDITLIAVLPQIGAFVFFILNMFGFNAKKLNFQADIKELEITAQDDEEVEITFKQDGVKIMRTIRRFIREFFYYVKENRTIFIIICTILLGVTFYTIYKAFPEVISKNYNQGDAFLIDKLTYKFEDSIITNIDYKGDEIKKGAYYLVLKVTINNDTDYSKVIDYNNFRLMLGNEYIYPSNEMAKSFIDYANSSNKLAAHTKETVVIVFQIKSSDIKRNYRIKVNNGQAIQKKKLVGKYDTLTISPILISEKSIEGEYSAGTAVSLVSSNLGKSSFKAENAFFTDKYIYDYEFCVNDECDTYKNQVSLSYKSKNKILLVFDYEFNLDNTIPFYSVTSRVKKFVDSFVKVRYYDENDKPQYATVNNVTPNRLTKQIVLEVDSKVADSSNVALSITIRNKEYLIKIK